MAEAMTTTTTNSRVEQRTSSKPNPPKKNDDIPFAYIYFGFIALFLTFNWRTFTKTMPTFRSLFIDETSYFIPELKTLMLPMFSLLVVCPALTYWRSFLKNNYISPIAESWAGLKPGSLKHDKFLEQAWLAVHYTVATSLGYFVLKEAPWWPPVISERAVKEIVVKQEDRDLDQEDPGLFLLYALQLGFYMLEFFTLVRNKNRRSDAMVYFLHHIFTIFLLAGSWVSYHHRIGSLVLFLHDLGDIFLPIGKCYTYAEEHLRTSLTKEKFERHKMIGMGFFVLFVIAFAIPRLFFFGGLIYQSFDRNHWLTCCGLEGDFCGQCKLAKLYPSSLVFTLGLLYPLHVFWFYLIVKMAVRLLLQPGQYDDVRSDDE